MNDPETKGARESPKRLDRTPGQGSKPVWDQVYATTGFWGLPTTCPLGTRRSFATRMLTVAGGKVLLGRSRLTRVKRPGWVHAETCAHMYIYMHIYIYIHICIYMYMYAYTCAYAYT